MRSMQNNLMEHIGYSRNVQIIETLWCVYILTGLLRNFFRTLCNFNVIIWAKEQRSTNISEHMRVKTKFRRR